MTDWIEFLAFGITALGGALVGSSVIPFYWAVNERRRWPDFARSCLRDGARLLALGVLVASAGFALAFIF